MIRRCIMTVSCFFLAITAFLPVSRANAWNKKTVFTFNEPIEIPGMALPAGTYVFKLLDNDADRDIVQVFNKNETKLYATILAIPDYRMNPTGKPVITFDERPHDSPQAVDAWFYPGDNYGMEFVYPKERASLLAQANNRPVLSHHASSQASEAELKTTPVKAINPGGKEVELAAVIQPPAAPPAMPHTASNVPLIAVIGLLLVALALALPRITRLFP